MNRYAVRNSQIASVIKPEMFHRFFPPGDIFTRYSRSFIVLCLTGGFLRSVYGSSSEF